MSQNFTRFAFTDSVKQAQERYGSRGAYARMENAGDRYVLSEPEIGFIQGRDSFYMATVGQNGWPYVQFRGGPRGFLKVLDHTTLGMVDFLGNRQYISVGNINATHKASLFLIDYPMRRRLKIWAEAEVLHPEDDAELAAKVDLPDYSAKVERLIVFRIQAFDWNCPQHITPRYTAEEIKHGLITLDPELIKTCCPDQVKAASQ